MKIRSSDKRVGEKEEVRTKSMEANDHVPLLDKVAGGRYDDISTHGYNSVDTEEYPVNINSDRRRVGRTPNINISPITPQSLPANMGGYFPQRLREWYNERRRNHEDYEEEDDDDGYEEMPYGSFHFPSSYKEHLYPQHQQPPKRNQHHREPQPATPDNGDTKEEEGEEDRDEEKGGGGGKGSDGRAIDACAHYPFGAKVLQPPSCSSILI